MNKVREENRWRSKTTGINNMSIREFSKAVIVNYQVIVILLGYVANAGFDNPTERGLVSELRPEGSPEGEFGKCGVPPKMSKFLLNRGKRGLKRKLSNK